MAAKRSNRVESPTQQGSIEIGPPLKQSFFEREAVTCARELIGTILRWGSCAGLVVETEAYSEHGDEACHTFFRPSARKFVVEKAPGAAYVYINYGVHWLTNVLIKNPASGECGFVLVRALEPIRGIGRMQKRRGRERHRDLCSGPGKLSQALGIDGKHHGSLLTGGKTRGFFHPQEPLTSVGIVADKRIGISRAKDLEWRFLARDHPHVSVPFGRAK